MLACSLHPENECNRDVNGGKCVCAPPGRKHNAACAAMRGEGKCDCMVLVVANDPLALTSALLRSQHPSKEHGDG